MQETEPPEQSFRGLLNYSLSKRKTYLVSFCNHKVAVQSILLFTLLTTQLAIIATTLYYFILLPLVAVTITNLHCTLLTAGDTLHDLHNVTYYLQSGTYWTRITDCSC